MSGAYYNSYEPWAILDMDPSVGFHVTYNSKLLIYTGEKLFLDGFTFSYGHVDTDYFGTIWEELSIHVTEIYNYDPSNHME